MKHFTLWAGRAGMQNTGVFLNRGDLFTVMATGSLDYCVKGGCDYHDVRPENGWPLLVRIGKDRHYFRPLMHGKNGYTHTSPAAGNLHVGYKQGKVTPTGESLNANYYNNDSGSFSIDIIVWATDDYRKIAGVLEGMSKKSPQNFALDDALNQAQKWAEWQTASAETEKQIEKTKKELASMKKAGTDEKFPIKKAREQRESGSVPKTAGKTTKDTTEVIAKKQTESKPSESSQTDAQDLDRIAQLETRLAKLMGQLQKLEQMKQEFEEEKKKSEELARELEEKQKREQELVDQLKAGKKSPPVIVIATPKDQSKVEVNIIHLNGVAEDETALERLEIYVNGKRVNTRQGRGIKVTPGEEVDRLEFNERIPLEKGTNRVRLVAYDADGLSTEKVLTIENVETRKNVWAVVVGIDEYPNIRQLKYAVNDARAFCNHLHEVNRLPPENITLLLNEEATLTRLRSTLGTHLKKKASKDDMVIIFFAGHGATEKDVMSPDGDGLEKYLLPYDANPNDLYATALPMGEISRIFNRIRSERLVFVADSCYSGASGGRTIGIGGIRANISEAFLDRVAGGKGRVIITASGANEVSAENDALGHGVFTYYLIQGLKGKADIDQDGMITVDEAFRYVSREVPNATGQEQHPVKKGTVEGRLILSITP